MSHRVTKFPQGIWTMAPPTSFLPSVDGLAQDHSLPLSLPMLLSILAFLVIFMAV